MRYLMYMPKPDWETSKPSSGVMMLDLDHIPHQDHPAENDAEDQSAPMAFTACRGSGA